MIMKKLIFITIITILFSSFLFSNQIEYFKKNKIYSNSNFPNYIKIKSFLLQSDFNQGNTMDNLFYFKNSFENIINNKTSSVPEPDMIIIFTFINSIYYLIKFKINLWAYNRSLFFERNNKIKPYFNINIKNKTIYAGFDVNF